MTVFLYFDVFENAFQTACGVDTGVVEENENGDFELPRRSIAPLT